MSAKKLLNILAFALLLCTLLTAFALADSKIITFDADNTTDIDATLSCPNKGVVMSVNNGILRIDMPLEAAYFSGDCSADVNINIPDGKRFDINDYPYVKFRMRTNYGGGSIQFYYATTSNLLKLNVNSEIRSGKWHDVELHHIDGHVSDTTEYDRTGITETNSSNYVASNGQKYFVKINQFNVDPAAYIKIQFKDMKKTPNEDFYAEIDYIGFFKNKQDMLAYEAGKKDIGDDYDAYFFAGDYIQTKASSSNKSPTKIVNGALRIFPANPTSDGNADFEKVLYSQKNASLSLIDYPYLSIKYRSNWTGELQFYPVMPSNPYVSKLVASNPWPSFRDLTWRTAKFSLNANDAVSNSNYGVTGALITSTPDTLNDGETLNWVLRGTSASNVFPTKENGISSDGKIKLQMKGTVADPDGKYSEVKYVAMFKNKADMYAAENDVTTDDMDKMLAAVEYIDNATFEYTMHAAVNESALKNYIRDTIEENAGVDVIVKSGNFVAGEDGTYTYEIHLIAGNVYGRDIVNVTVTNLAPIALSNFGAQIRADGTASALRFGFVADVDTDDYSNVTVGAVVLPKAFRYTTSHNALEKISAQSPSQQTGITSNKTPAALTTTNVYVAENDGLHFNAVVTGIPDGSGNELNEYGNEIIARPFVSYTFNGRTYTIYGTEIARSVDGVKAAFEADSELEWNA